MENKLIIDLEQQLTNIDIDHIQLDAIIQLKNWQKKLFLLIEKIYLKRLNEIDELALNIKNEIEDKYNEIKTNNQKIAILLKLQHDIDHLKSNIIVDQIIPKDFHHLIEQTIHIKCDNNDIDEDDDFVIVNIDKNEEKTESNPDNCITKIFNSTAVQQALTVSMAQTLTYMGTIAITNPTTIAATTIAKTALLTSAYGLGKIAMNTTKKFWSFT